MTRHGDTRLAALRPFLKLIRPESRYVYVCGNVPTPVAICNILLRFFFITSRPGTPAFSLSLILSLGRDEIESRLRGAKRHGARTKSRSKGGWERSGGGRLRGVVARLKISNGTLHALFSTFLRPASEVTLDRRRHRFQNQWLAVAKKTFMSGFVSRLAHANLEISDASIRHCQYPIQFFFKKKVKTDL